MLSSPVCVWHALPKCSNLNVIDDAFSAFGINFVIRWCMLMLYWNVCVLPIFGQYATTSYKICFAHVLKASVEKDFSHLIENAKRHVKASNVFINRIFTDVYYAIKINVKISEA